MMKRPLLFLGVEGVISTRQSLSSARSATGNSRYAAALSTPQLDLFVGWWNQYPDVDVVVSSRHWRESALAMLGLCQALHDAGSHKALYDTTCSSSSGKSGAITLYMQENSGYLSQEKWGNYTVLDDEVVSGHPLVQVVGGWTDGGLQREHVDLLHEWAQGSDSV